GARRGLTAPDKDPNRSTKGSAHMPARRDGACAAPFFRQYLRYGTGGLWSCSCACLAAMKLPAFSFPRFGRRQPRRTDRADGLSSPRQTIAVVGSPDLRPPLEDVVGPGAYDVRSEER